MGIGVSTVQRKNLIGGGLGYVQIGACTSPPNSGINLQDLGSIEGSISEVFDREVFSIWKGQPQYLSDQKVIKEVCRISFILKELWIKDIAKFIGFSDTDITTQATSSETITDEIKILNGTNPVYLYGRNISSVTYVRSAAGGTGTLYTSSDYVFDLTLGTIRRTADSTILDGGTVYIKYIYTRPDRRYFSVGGSTTVNTYFLRVVYLQNNGKRQFSDYYRVMFASPLQLKKNAGGINNYEVNLIALADTSKSAGNYYGRKYYEY